MKHTLITAPEREPLTLQEVKDFLRVDGEDHDPRVSAAIVAAREWVETLLHRVLITQTWDSYYDDLPGQLGILPLPFSPAQSITSITYYDTAGDLQTLSAALYALDSSGPSDFVYRAYDQDWPAVRDFQDSVIVRAVYGYGDSPGDVPEPIRQAMLLWIQAHFDLDQREMGALIKAANNLAQPYRLYTF